MLIDLTATLFCVVFGEVYELFSHGVYSYGMIYAFMFPLALGVLPLMLMGILHTVYPKQWILNIYHAGIATLTVGSIVSGVLEIYGTTNPLTVVYWILGTTLTVFGAGGYLIPLMKKWGTSI